MTRTRIDSVIVCQNCTSQLGTVYAKEDDLRPGFWSHFSTPESIPKICPTCKQSPERIMQEYTVV